MFEHCLILLLNLFQSSLKMVSTLHNSENNTSFTFLLLHENVPNWTRLTAQHFHVSAFSSDLTVVVPVIWIPVLRLTSPNWLCCEASWFGHRHTKTYNSCSSTYLWLCRNRSLSKDYQIFFSSLYVSICIDLYNLDEKKTTLTEPGVRKHSGCKENVRIIQRIEKWNNLRAKVRIQV